MKLRTVVRSVALLVVILITWCAAGAVDTNTPAAALLGFVAAIALIVVTVALLRREYRS